MVDAKLREKAAQLGMLTPIKRIINDAVSKKHKSIKPNVMVTKEPLEFALPILFEMTRTKSIIPILNKLGIAKVYPQILLLGYPYSVQALDSLSLWFVLDKNELMPYVTAPDYLGQIVNFFRECDTESFSPILESCIRMATNSNRMSEAFVQEKMLEAIVKRLKDANIAARVRLLKFIDILYEASKYYSTSYLHCVTNSHFSLP